MPALGECASPRATIWCAGTFFSDLPLNLICPPTGLSSPERVRRVVVLPAPLVPMSVTTSPASTLNEMPLTASILP